MSAHLVGTGYSLASITDNLHNALSTSNLVRQEAVYKNLQKLLTEGIVNNSEQRAFLQTISDDLGMVFDATNGSLTRLIRIQQQDLSANRLAIEYSLQEFLNQNYQTSEYIRNGYTNVSNAILEAQSLMNANQAVQLETAIQT
jgi:hypothetical protein